LIYTIAKQKIFIPEFNGNKEAEKGDQIRITIGFPSVSEVAEASGEYDNQVVFSFLSHVKKVEGLQLEIDGKIKDAEPLDIIETPGLIELFMEIKDEYEKLTVIDKKKLK